MQWLKLPAWEIGDRGFESHLGLQVSKAQNVSSPLTRNDSILWGTSVTEEACPASDRRGPIFESCVWRAVSSHHPREVLLVQFSLYVHKGGLTPHSFHLSLTLFFLFVFRFIPSHNTNPLNAKHDYNPLKSVLLADPITMISVIGNEICV